MCYHGASLKDDVHYWSTVSLRISIRLLTVLLLPKNVPPKGRDRLEGTHIASTSFSPADSCRHCEYCP